MKFNYQVRTKKGEIQTGTVEASSQEAALALLQKHKLYVTFLERAEALPFLTRRIKIFRGISGKEIIIFSRQLAIMFKSKVPPVETLHTLSRQTKNPNFKEKILKIAEEVEGGTPLSKALSYHPKLFSSFYISMVKSGEALGNLSGAIDYLADHLEKEDSLRAKMKGAMIYPAFVFFVFLIVIGAMVIFVIPQLAKVLTATETELPLMTKLVIEFSDFLRNWGWVIIIGFLGLMIFIFRYSKTTGGKKFFDKNFLKIPLLSSLLKKIYLSRFAENLSTLISGGLPITRALEITGEIVGNDVYKTIILQTRDEVRKGEKISSVLQRYPEVIPPLFTQMTMVGEKTGRLDTSLMNIVDFYRKEVDRAVDNFTSILEPLLIVFLGLFVALLIGAVLMPLYQIGTL